MKRTADKLLISLAKESLAARDELRSLPDKDSDDLAKALLSLRGALATLRKARFEMAGRTQEVSA